ncbi:hypothetical protein NDN08_002434 [Rhodosorus marinus]|uniref:Transcription elongation factor SPT5 n=1 Tax=Rhodosorus marinus TaxID=101924 RepID=A0AAV8UXT4_9RHOD|nr:hypothetical protein NDN08_002434 [Rhodosorus marinus]
MNWKPKVKLAFVPGGFVSCIGRRQGSSGCRRRCIVGMSVGGHGSSQFGDDFKACLDRNWDKFGSLDEEEDDEDLPDQPQETSLGDPEEDSENDGVQEVASGAELVAESGLHFDQNRAPEWFFLQARAGMEDRVRASVDGMVNSLPNIARKVADVIVPKIGVMQLTKAGKTVKKDDRMFPGYLLIYMVMDFPTWREINNVPYVQGFVGDTNQKDFKGTFQKPPAVPPQVIQQIFQRLASEGAEDGTNEPDAKFLPGQRIKITAGPFSNYEGSVVKVIPEQSVATVKVFVLNRITEEEVSFDQMEVKERSPEDGTDELDEILGQVEGLSNVNMKKLRRRNRDFKKGDVIVVKSGPYGGCTGVVKQTLPRQGKVTVALKMFNRTLKQNLPYDVVRLENEDDEGNLLTEDKSEDFVGSETDDDGFEEGEDVSRVDAASAKLEGSEDKQLLSVLKDFTEHPSTEEDDDVSDEEFLQRIDQSIPDEDPGESDFQDRRSRTKVTDSKTWFKKAPVPANDLDSLGLAPLMDSDELEDLPSDHQGFEEDLIIEDEDEDELDDPLAPQAAADENEEEDDDINFLKAGLAEEGDSRTELLGFDDEGEDGFLDLEDVLEDEDEVDNESELEDEEDDLNLRLDTEIADLFNEDGTLAEEFEVDDDGDELSELEGLDDLDLEDDIDEADAKAALEDEDVPLDLLFSMVSEDDRTRPPAKGTGSGHAKDTKVPIENTAAKDEEESKEEVSLDWLFSMAAEDEEAVKTKPKKVDTKLDDDFI